MEKVLYYLARDGAKFYSEEACKLYDAKKAVEERGMIFWMTDCSNNYHLVKLTENTDEIAYADWCYIPENSKPFDRDTIKEIEDVWHTHQPNEPGFYKKKTIRMLFCDDPGEYEWINIQTRINKIDEEKCELERAVEEMKELQTKYRKWRTEL